uniref:Uncharacterized protein n=1 Tax=Candidatus Methanogaster sp. ANME-2c ERB4 TaxID=2759911 RepID=A0A7G9YHB7_9EURY|nr:hypothetical protein FLPANLNF_00020 [Methanosarcinales archaeon ANME-2c ERB4]
MLCVFRRRRAGRRGICVAVPRADAPPVGAGTWKGVERGRAEACVQAAGGCGGDAPSQAIRRGGAVAATMSPPLNFWLMQLHFRKHKSDQSA